MSNNPLLVSDSFHNSVGQAPVFRLRPDVQAISRWRGTQRYWVLKQTFSLEHFEATEDEWFLLKRLNGSQSTSEMVNAYNQQFSPRKLSETRLQQFLHIAAESGVVLIEGADRAISITESQKKYHRKQVVSGLFHAIAPRISLVDPRPLLRVLDPLATLIFRPQFLMVAVVLATLLLTFALGQVSEISFSLGSLEYLVNSGYFLSLLIVWTIVKIAHELGHGMACQRFGSECHDIGVFFIAGLPMLYCDVSDAWTLPSRWQRAVISAAGVYVEFLIAIACGFLWLVAEPGIIRAILGQVVLVCGVSTLLFNLNPLLRLDAYYLVSDLVDCPNLHEKSRRILWNPMLRWLTKGHLGERTEPSSWWLPIYGIASICYRMFVMLLICWIVWSGLKSAGLEAIGFLFILVAVVGMLTPAAIFAWQIIRRPFAIHAFSQLRVGLAFLILTAILAITVWLPLPQTLLVPAMVIPDQSQVIVAPSSGRLISNVRYGDYIELGGLIGRIDDPQLTFRIAEAKAIFQELRLERVLLENRLAYDESAAARIETLNAAEKGAADKLVTLRQEQAALALIADQSGFVSEPQARQLPSKEAELAAWQGLTLSPENSGCWVQPGDPIGEIVNVDALRALLLIEQKDLDLVSVGASVRLRFDNAPSRTLQGVITLLGRRPVKKVPPTLIVSHAITEEFDSRGQMRPRQEYFYAEVKISSSVKSLKPRSPGNARIQITRCSIQQWIRRELSQIFFVAG